MKCLPLSKLNAAAAVPEALVQEGERLYAERINDAAECIFEQREQRPVVLIS